MTEQNPNSPEPSDGIPDGLPEGVSDDFGASPTGIGGPGEREWPDQAMSMAHNLPVSPEGPMVPPGAPSDPGYTPYMPGPIPKKGGAAKVWGIILIVLGALGLLSRLAGQGNVNTGNSISQTTFVVATVIGVLISIAMVVIGIWLVRRAGKQNA